MFGIGLIGNSEAKIPVNKCCQLNEVLNDIGKDKNYTSYVCQHSESNNEELWKNYTVTIKMTPKDEKIFVVDGNDRLEIQSGGFLIGKKDGVVDYIYNEDNATFCVDLNANNSTFIALILLNERAHHQLEGKPGIFYSAAQSIGIFFLIITGLIYLKVTPLRNYHGQAIVCHSFLLALAMALNAWSNYFIDFVEVHKNLLRLAQFCHLSSYFWLTAMWMNSWCHSLLKRRKLTQQDFLFSFGIISAVALGMVIARANKWLYCIKYFEFDKRGIFIFIYVKYVSIQQ